MLNSFKIGLSSLCLKLFRLSSEKLLKGFLISLLETVENLYIRPGLPGQCDLYSKRERDKAKANICQRGRAEIMVPSSSEQ